MENLKKYTIDPLVYLDKVSEYRKTPKVETKVVETPKVVETKTEVVKATEVKVEYDNTEASKGTVVDPTGTAAGKDAKGVSITDMKSGEKGTLVVTFTDKNDVVTTSTIDYQYN